MPARENDANRPARPTSSGRQSSRSRLPAPPKNCPNSLRLRGSLTPRRPSSARAAPQASVMARKQAKWFRLTKVPVAVSR